MWMWKWNVIRYDISDIEPLITMYRVRNWMTLAQFCKFTWISTVTIWNWMRKWSVPVMMVHRLRKYIDIDFMKLRPVNTDGIE